MPLFPPEKLESCHFLADFLEASKLDIQLSLPSPHGIPMTLLLLFTGKMAKWPYIYIYILVKRKDHKNLIVKIQNSTTPTDCVMG